MNYATNFVVEQRTAAATMGIEREEHPSKRKPRPGPHGDATDSNSFGPINNNKIAGGGISNRGLFNVVVGLMLFIFVLRRGTLTRMGDHGIPLPGFGGNKIGLREHPGPPLMQIIGAEGLVAIIAPRKDRVTCPHWQSMGCMGAVIEKLCEGTSGTTHLLDPKTPENIWQCCCPKPYQPCEASKVDKKCQTTMKKWFDPLIAGDKPGDVPVEQASKAILISRQELSQSEGLWGSCRKAISVHAEAPRVCPKNSQGHRVVHPALLCETMTWQWEELGDGNEDKFQRNGCPIPTKKGKRAFKRQP